jgi:hypothetical protein
MMGAAPEIASISRRLREKLDRTRWLLRVEVGVGSVSRWQEVPPYGFVSRSAGSQTQVFIGSPGREVSGMLSPGDVAHAVRMVLTQEPNSFISEIILGRRRNRRGAPFPKMS